MTVATEDEARIRVCRRDRAASADDKVVAGLLERKVCDPAEHTCAIELDSRIRPTRSTLRRDWWRADGD